jgi:negative regulator of flagellin synthesis FlgM
VADNPPEFKSFARTIMKIEGPYKANTAPVTPRAQPKVANESPPTAAEVVSLSQLTSALQASEKPPVNLARIQEIKEAIAQGKFKINPEAIAGRLIETARDMVVAQRRA